MLRKKVYFLFVLIIMLLLAFFLSSCKIVGSGNIETEEREIGSIDSVILTTIGTLHIEQTGQFSLSVEAEDNILPVITTKTSDGKLKIGIEKVLNPLTTKEINYYLTVKDLDLISATSSGDVICDGLETEKLELNLSSSGNIEILLNVEMLEVGISSSGDLIVFGESKNQNVRLSSSGNYMAEELISSECTIKISSSGDATVNVSDYLDANLSSSGNLYFKGNPKTGFTTSSSGKIESID